MKKKNIIILVVSIVVVITLVMTVLFIGIPTYLNMQARKILQNTVSSSGETTATQLDEQEKQIFNSKFTSYETVDEQTTSSTQVLMLFSFVANNNDNMDEKKVDVNGTIITNENVDAVKSCISKDLKYKIKCVYDEEGYVKTIDLKYVD